MTDTVKGYSIINAWNKSTTTRMEPGGDLYRRPLTRAEMCAPLSWAEQQLAVVHRYGELSDGSVGWLKVCRD